MSETTVVHVRDMRPGDIYIGRSAPRRGLTASPFANPFPIGEEHNRASVIAYFETWVRTSDDPKAVYMREHLEDLRGKRLACWCRPANRCHGDVLVKILNEGSQI